MFGGSSIAGLEALSLLETLIVRAPYSKCAVDDLSPLMALKSLRYVEIEKTKDIPRKQIEALLKAGVEVKIGNKRYQPKGERHQAATVSMEDVRALEREAERLLQADRHRERLEVLQRALAIREQLAALVASRTERRGNRFAEESKAELHSRKRRTFWLESPS